MDRFSISTMKLGIIKNVLLSTITTTAFEDIGDKGSVRGH
jgi:hypothetical protein